MILNYKKYSMDSEVPGTTTLVTNEVSQGEDNTIVLIPQPTSSPNDPLNWGKGYKSLQLVLICVYILLSSISMNWTSTVSAIYVEKWHVSYTQINIGTAVMYFVSVPSCILIQTICNTCGRRIIYISSMALVVTSSVVFAACPNYKGYMAYCAINGIAVSPINFIMEISINDIFFLHEHAKLMAIFVLCVSMGSTLGTIFSGYISSKLPTWSWMNYFIIIFGMIILVSQILFLEESMFERGSQSLHVSEFSRQESKIETVISVREINNTVPRKPFKSRLGFLSESRKPFKEQFLRIARDPFRTLRYPAVFWCTLSFGVQICWYSLIGNSIAQFYSVPPYNFSSTGLGNLNYAAIPGLLASLLYVSLSDRYQVYKSLANGGISEPEFRLDLIYFPVIVNMVGLFLYGFGPAYKMTWVVGAMGIAFINFGIGGVSSIMFTFVLESYPKQVTSTVMMILIVQNLIGGMFCWVFQYWMDGLGLKGITIFLAALCFVINFSSLILRFWGKNFRHYTIKWYD